MNRELGARQQQGGQSQTLSQSQSQSLSQTQSVNGSTVSGSQSQTASGTASSFLSIPQSAPAGLLTITQPPQQSTSYFKIAQNQFITFGWNFSYIIATPTHLTVSAVCENGNTYPVGPTNGIIPGTATSVVWDPYTYQTNNPNLPLAQAKYTLEIWGDGGPDAVREPGVLTPNSALQFALYTPQAYTPINSGWSCAGCSSAVSQHITHPTFIALIATLMVMFISGSALLRRI
ncbi:uncharacterized protein EDB93DRAFT_544536 [Suillus bovinus]|uniref:uncharacterized protein n=1 Tax=Suillus bovinus TaxID=48563 RepID=UPI001B884453|nr:uncharacterized protein EDB93DRAFT_544536 [Suillus bovinus]KAG2144112.1 hypothetical protein EDB93DRAFT_544536 [Suillus bovinus]